MKFLNTHIVLFWLTMLIFTNPLVGQNYFEEYQNLDTLLSRKVPNSTADSLITLCRKEGDLTSLAQIAHLHAIRPRNSGNYHNAIRYAQIEISTLEETGQSDGTYSIAVYNLGRFYFEDIQFEQAIEQYEKVIARNDHPLKIAQSYAETGRCYSKLGQFYKSIDYFEKSLPILEDLGRYTSLINQIINIAEPLWILGSKKDLEKRMLYLLKADSLAKLNKVTYRNRISLTNALGNQYVSDHHYDFNKARYHFSANLDSAFQRNDSSKMATALNNLSHLYNLEKKDSAIYFVRQGLRYNGLQITRAKLYENLSNHYLSKSNYEGALENIHKALEVNIGQSLDMKEEINIYQLNNANFKDHTLTCLKKKAGILIRLFEQSSSETHLTEALKNIETADILVGLIHEDVSDDLTKLLWREKAAEVYSKGAFVAMQLKRPDLVFSFMEKSKAFLLSEEIARNRAYANLPKDVATRESALKKELLRLEHEVQASSNTKSLRASLFSARRSYENFLDSLKQAFPVYFQGRLSITPLALEKVRATMEKDELLISYIWNKLHKEEEVIIVLVADSENTTVLEIKNPSQVNQLIYEYQKLVSRPLETKKDQEQLQKVSLKLFEALFPAEELRNQLSGKDISLILDGMLQQIPFESLIVNQAGQYLMESVDINYLYSRSFQAYNETVKRKPKQSFLGYAPVEFLRTGLTSLNNTEEEVQSIYALMTGTLKTKTEATKTDFMTESGAYNVIHLATHARAGQDPWIAFSDEKLSHRELYTHKINANLVTLSACNTSVGEVASGEGVISLARGFFYSGAKSVVSSLWNINDQSTVSIMSDFYANLEAGQTKSEALNNAKRQYLNTHTLSEKSPYHWASFVLIGDPGELNDTTSDHSYYLLLLAVAIAFVLLFRKIRKKKIS